MRTATGQRVRYSLVLAAAVLLGAACGGEASVSTAASEPSTEEAVTAVTTPEAAGAETETAVGAAAPSAAGSAMPEGTVHVVLSEWIVEPDPGTAPAGDVTFLADDQGGDEHELVMVRADDPADLPTDADGTVDEDQIAEDDFIGEIEELEPGTQDEATFTVEPGTYVLFCNITEDEDGEVVSHFAEGMHTTFTVTE